MNPDDKDFQESIYNKISHMEEKNRIANILTILLIPLAVMIELFLKEGTIVIKVAHAIFGCLLIFDFVFNTFMKKCPHCERSLGKFFTIPRNCPYCNVRLKP